MSASADRAGRVEWSWLVRASMSVPRSWMREKEVVKWSPTLV